MAFGSHELAFPLYDDDQTTISDFIWFFFFVYVNFFLLFVSMKKLTGQLIWSIMLRFALGKMADAVCPKPYHVHIAEIVGDLCIIFWFLSKYGLKILKIK